MLNTPPLKPPPLTTPQVTPPPLSTGPHKFQIIKLPSELCLRTEHTEQALHRIEVSQPTVAQSCESQLPWEEEELEPGLAEALGGENGLGNTLSAIVTGTNNRAGDGQYNRG